MSPTTQSRPTVSVVMCTYNGAPFLEAQLDSILAQDHAPFEVIVQDDGSTDATLTLLERYAARHPVVRVVQNERRLGFNANFASAMRRARGEWVALADQDDVWMPQRLSRQLQAVGQADACFCAYYRDAEWHGDDGNWQRRVSPSGTMASLVFANVIPGHTLLLRRSFLEREGVVRADFYYDWWLLVQAHLGGGLVRLDEALVWHRPHAASAIARLHQAARGGAPERRATWQPYVLGWRHLLRLRRLPAWRRFYGYVAEATAGRADMTLPHLLAARLMGRRGGIVALCLTCLRHRATLYPPRGEGAWLNRLRALCLPAIYAYRNSEFNPENFPPQR